jgi:predicted nucleic acid-binding protein
LTSGEDLHAPAVLQFEVLNVLARQVWDKQLAPSRASACWTDLSLLDIAVHGFDDLTDGPRALGIAQQLGRRHATDCAYVALAERLGAQVWTIDQSLARAAGQARLPVHLLE